MLVQNDVAIGHHPPASYETQANGVGSKLAGAPREQ